LTHIVECTNLNSLISSKGTATAEIYTLSLHDALPILRSLRDLTQHLTTRADDSHAAPVSELPKAPPHLCRVLWMSRPGKVLRVADRKSTRLNSSHVKISYAVFCLKKKIPESQGEKCMP